MKDAKPRDRREYHRRWYLKNSEKKGVQTRAWRIKNRERSNELSRISASKDREKSRACQKRWRDKNKPYNALRMGKYRVKRRSLEKAAAVNLASIKRWVSKVRARLVNSCYYCERLVTLEDLHFDHVIPISKGGQHSVGNLCVSCSHCNHVKSATMPSDWRYHDQLFLNL